MVKPNKNEWKLIAGIAAVPIALGIIFYVWNGWGSTETGLKDLELPPRNDNVTEVPIMINYGTKIVYTTETTTDKEPFKNDCDTRGGTFNICGNTCEPGAATCAQSCALTCESR